MRILFITYNRLDFTIKAFKALEKNTNADTEIIVIDNGSTDGTKEWLKIQKERIETKIWELILNEKNRGVAGAMNQFLELTASEEFVGKVDNDTIIPKNCFEELLKEVKEHNLDIIQAKHEVNCSFPSWDEWMATLKKDGNIYYSSFVGGSPIIIRRKVLKDSIKEEDGVWVWTKYQAQRPELRIAFASNVNAHLLDMKGDNNPDYSEHLEYYFKTGRLKA